MKKPASPEAPRVATWCLRVGRAYTPVQVVERAAIVVRGRHIQAVVPWDDLSVPADVPVVEAGHLWAAPGFVELQINGAYGCDFTQDPDCIPALARRLPAFGVAAFLPTIVSSPPEVVRHAVDVVRRLPERAPGARVLGLHLEGPFLNPHQAGAHNPRHLRPPSLEFLAALEPLEPVRLVTLAPELPGADEVIGELRRRGIVVAAGHTMATYDEALHALDLGVAFGTHVFNVMRPLHHREPGIVGAFLTDPRPAVGLIPDGLHVHPAVVRLIWCLKGPQGVCAVTDAMAALGMPPGRYRLGDVEVLVDETSARVPSGLLAGSILHMDQGVRNLRTFTGCTVAEALQAVTLNPARLLGMDDHLGRIAPGCLASLVLLDRDLRVLATVVEGRVAHWMPEAGEPPAAFDKPPEVGVS
ncbi:MAG: N-acetylglucosamine-6-phosphate deacetylase [Anaerolineae bacterium]|nr:N-acetylglucosamine-6-phosphate deacetylase [Anaerolineae bacterium]